jgi:hypothetical protein
MQSCPTCGYVYVKRSDLVLAAFHTHLSCKELDNVIVRDWISDKPLPEVAATAPKNQWWCGQCDAFKEEVANG